MRGPHVVIISLYRPLLNLCDQTVGTMAYRRKVESATGGGPSLVGQETQESISLVCQTIGRQTNDSDRAPRNMSLSTSSIYEEANGFKTGKLMLKS